MAESSAGPIVRHPEQVPVSVLAPGVTTLEMLNDSHGCRGLHQRRLRFADGAALTGSIDGRGEAWYVISGAGRLEAAGSPAVDLEPGVAVWLAPSASFDCEALPDLEVLVITVRAGAPDDRCAATHMMRLDECEPERTGDREFRVLLSSGLSITQFVGMIPPGRAPEHQHTYDEVVHVLAGHGVAHLGDTETELVPGSSIYLPPHQPHCLENNGADTLRVLGVFYPAGSPAAKKITDAG
jgi:quercetin dioxygenase-like cupin family protein